MPLINSLAPKVSIIIPSYNSMRFIGKCLRSVLATDYLNFEVILVDDCSIDGSLEYAKKTFGHDKRLKIIKNPKKLGPAASRNAGIRVATGDYLAFIETDIEVKPDRLKEALKVLTSDSLIGAVYCKVRDINERDRIQATGLLILPHF
jgi:teichuronic acid biosynthesis glycosyltransferase TuaG